MLAFPGRTSLRDGQFDDAKRRIFVWEPNQLHQRHGQ